MRAHTPKCSNTRVSCIQTSRSHLSPYIAFALIKPAQVPTSPSAVVTKYRYSGYKRSAVVVSRKRERHDIPKCK